MIDKFEYILFRMFDPDQEPESFSIFNPSDQFDDNADLHTDIARSLNSAFLITLAGKRHRDSERAATFIRRMAKTSEWTDLAGCYQAGKTLIQNELEAVCVQNTAFRSRVENLYERLNNEKGNISLAPEDEGIWSVFFPEGTGIFNAWHHRVEQLRKKRTVRIMELNPSPLTDPGRQLLFTSNVLLTVPDESMDIKELDLTRDLKDGIIRAACEPQKYWYDHPVQIGVRPDHNEVFHGLQGLEEMVEYESSRGNMTEDKITCLLSVSVTHQGLQDLAKRYLEEEIAHTHGFRHINLYVCTEADTEIILAEILCPAAEHYFGQDSAAELLSVFGVDGEYGRHYSFLKAISAFWNILIDPEIRATFKIDLDQVFPQNKLVEQSGASAFEHLLTPLWGARGIDAEGQTVELGMIAGSLVNEDDIDKTLFTPDVKIPPPASTPEEKVFFSPLPQALSTEAEMMTRYNTKDLDGEKTCIQRIHVTGGTNGIRIDSLCRYRPFTPSFIGRAEDQAYILSAMPGHGEHLVYVHKDGLIMRHDKKTFARDAIQAASAGKLVGDYVRTIFFSEYATVLTDDVPRLKNAVDPFTGCFISIIPKTIVFLRFCLKAASYFASGKEEKAFDFLTMGIPRIRNAINFADEKEGRLRHRYEKEQDGWNLYYDVLEAIKKGLINKDDFAIKMEGKAKGIMQRCLITQKTGKGRKT